MSKNSLILGSKDGDPLFRFLIREVREEKGAIKAIKSGGARVTLSEAKGEIACFAGGGMITSEGYRSLNTVASLNCLTPASIEVPGQGRMANPYIETDPETGAFRSGWMRKVVIGPSPVGNMTLVDRTTYLTLHEYLIQDLLAVQKRAPIAVLWGFRHTTPDVLLASFIPDHNERIAEESSAPGKAWLRKYLVTEREERVAKRRVAVKTWAFLPVEKVTGQGIWYDSQHEEVAKAFRTYTQSGQFGIRKLEAITFRNAIREHPLMPAMKVDASRLVGPKDARTYDTTVYFHETIEGEEQVKTLVAEFEAGLRSANLTAVSPAIESAKREDEAAEDGDDTVAGEAPEKPALGQGSREGLILSISALMGDLPAELINRLDEALVHTAGHLNEATDMELDSLRDALLAAEQELEM